MEKKSLIGLGLAAAAVALLVSRAGGQEPPPPPPPGYANLYGNVTDAETGINIAGVIVTLNGYQVVTDNAGNYSFVEIEPGNYTLTFEKDGYETLQL